MLGTEAPAIGVRKGVSHACEGETLVETIAKTADNETIEATHKAEVQSAWVTGMNRPPLLWEGVPRQQDGACAGANV